MKRNSQYRKIWKDHFGEIPVDNNGISYEIHHKDFNPHNNNIENLECITIQDHYNKHFEAGQYYACAMIKRRMLMSEEDRKVLREKISISNKNKPNPMSNPDSRKKLSESLKRKYEKEVPSWTGRKRPRHSELMKSRGFGKNKSAEHVRNQTKSWIESTKDRPIRSKSWTIMHDENILEIKNLKKFCRDNNINYLMFYRKNKINGYLLIGPKD